MEVKIDKWLSKAGRIFNALKTTLMIKKEVPQDTKFKVIKKIIRATLPYGSKTRILLD